MICIFKSQSYRCVKFHFKSKISRYLLFCNFFLFLYQDISGFGMPVAVQFKCNFSPACTIPTFPTICTYGSSMKILNNSWIKNTESVYINNQTTNHIWVIPKHCLYIWRGFSCPIFNTAIRVHYFFSLIRRWLATTVIVIINISIIEVTPLYMFFWKTCQWWHLALETADGKHST